MSWLRDHLIRTGAMTERGVTRRVKARTCRCGTIVLTGLTDSKVCAIEATVDPESLNRLGEVQALLEGRYTVTARAEAGRFVLDDRNDFAIKGAPAGEARRADVLREHRCGTPSLVEPMTAPSSFATATAARLPPGSPAPF